jgi:hypothetical protein
MKSPLSWWLEVLTNTGGVGKRVTDLVKIVLLPEYIVQPKRGA